MDDGALRLANGTRVESDLRVGADGLRSAVRAWMLDDGPPTYCGYAAVRGIGPIDPAYPDGCIAYGRGLILFVSPIDDARAYWVASLR
ncbi:MAG: FAD-dependent oxidoreductase, partial [Pseudomonadota bacterium]